MKTATRRLVDEWVYGGALAGLALCIVGIGLAGRLSAAEFSVFLLLPIYMLHRYEEHAEDRFRIFINTVLGHGTRLLTRFDVFLINVPGVWGINAVAFALATTVHVGFGMIVAYTILINAVVHIAQAVRMRRYNPGLVTSIVLFLPASAWAIFALSASGAGFHVLGIAVGLAIHGLIMEHVLRHLRAGHGVRSASVLRSARWGRRCSDVSGLSLPV